MSAPARRRLPTVSLALGGGGARGLAHIVVLEALDDLGIVPTSIAGTSMGAIIGAAYAAGSSGKELRRHALATFRDRADVMARLFQARVGKLADLWSQGFGNPLQVDGEVVLQRFLPRPLPPSFADLSIPFVAVSTDFYGKTRYAAHEGPLSPAVAASMALPWLVRSVRLNGRFLVDGGATDPLPVRDADEEADIVIAVDVTGCFATPEETRPPGPMEAMLGMSLIMQSALTEARMAHASKRIALLRPAVQDFKILDFFAARAILAAAEPLRDQVRRIVRG